MLRGSNKKNKTREQLFLPVELVLGALKKWVVTCALGRPSFWICQVFSVFFVGSGFFKMGSRSRYQLESCWGFQMQDTRITRRLKKMTCTSPDTMQSRGVTPSMIAVSPSVTLFLTPASLSCLPVFAPSSGPL